MRELPGGFAVTVGSPTYRSVLLDISGAVAGEDEDLAVASHYGDPLREQRHLAERAAFVDRSHREILTVDGVDRLSWLNDLSTQEVRSLADGQVTETLVLSATGHVEHHAQVTELAGTVWLDVEQGTAAGLLGFLDSMRFMLRVGAREVTDDWAQLTVAGPDSPAVLGVLSIPAPEAGQALALAEGGWVRASPTSASGAASYDLLVVRGELKAWADRLSNAGATPAGLAAYEALRVEARRPRQGFETDHKTIPNELSWIRTAVHLTKGCYRGQETVARVHNLGRPPRRVALVHLDGVSEALPQRRAEVTWDGRAVGSVTSAAWHYELGPIALLSLKRNVPDDADLLVAGSVARIEPDPDAPPADVVPAGRAARDRLTGRDGSATIRA
ncbi:MAG: folate-binding protein YgfZ [Geodermatophilaceae bacterium]|nr:folate-binding protein YgfZ [Geodermatophilaceae bacterium]